MKKLMKDAKEGDVILHRFEERKYSVIGIVERMDPHLLPDANPLVLHESLASSIWGYSTGGRGTKHELPPNAEIEEWEMNEERYKLLAAASAELF